MSDRPVRPVVSPTFAFACACAVSAVAASAAPPPLEPCSVPGLESEARCATFPVLENRAAGGGRTIGLHVVVVPATSGQPTREAITFFAGGPGDSSTRAVGPLAHHFAAARATRDLVVVDYRGTGKSEPLVCTELVAEGVQGFLDSFLPTDAVAACRERLERERALALYTTNEAIDDIAEVLTSYGYTQTNLYGVSYGTRAAQVMARRHPGLVRTMVLEGPMRLDERDPLDFARAAQTALEGLLAECAGDPACAAAFPDLQGDLARIWARLEQGPVTVELLDAESGTKKPLRLSRQGLAQTVRYMLYMVSTAAALPAQIHAAAGGDFVPIAESAQLFGGFMTGTADGFFLSVTCPEDTRAIREEEISGAVTGTFLGDFRVRRQLAACAAWAPRAPDPAFREPLVSAVPTLILSGERDPVTPASNGDSIARHLTHVRHLVVADSAHDSSGMVGVDCLTRIMNEVVAEGSVDQLELGCVAEMARPPFVVAGPAPTVALDAARLAAFVGRYRHAEAGMEFAIEIAGDGLRLALAGRPPLALRPISAVKFEPVGLPPGFAVEFELDASGRPVALSFFEPGAPPARCARVE